MKTSRLSILVLVIVAVAIDASQAGCILSGITYPGGDIGVAVIKESKEKCQKYCQDTAGCLYFTWVDDTHPDPSFNKKCYLKNRIVKSKKKEGLYSGPKFCQGHPTNISKFEKGALDEHNSLRAKHGSDPLILDRQLSAKAEYWAKQLLAGKVPKDKKYPHSYSGAGENIWWGAPGKICNDDSGKSATKSWYSEIKNVDFEKMKPKNSTKPVGHFTAVVWKATTHFGIGYASNKKECWIVAQYLPQGNVIGVKNYRNNVKKPLQ